MSDARTMRIVAAGVFGLWLLGAATNCSEATPSTAGGLGGAGATGGAIGGDGGLGGEAPSCDDGCGAATPICLDGACLEDCPALHASCHTSAEPAAPGSCCEPGEQCCGAEPNGYSAGDRCHDAMAACPLECPDGVTLCNADQFCQLDAETMGYSCTDACSFVNFCTGRVCCPLGSSCDEGSCALADLTIDAPRIASSVRFEKRDFAPGSCEILEGCVQAPGVRTLLRFDLETPNIGTGDLVLGDPSEQTELFGYSPCHNHFHFESYADYSLEDLLGNEVAVGHKQAFCLLDAQAYLPGAPVDPRYTCQSQGIQAGWSDVYGSALPCQWVDVTDVPPGDYRLQVRVNYERILAETSYADNDVLVDVTIPQNTCPNGCRGYDPACCNGGDTCGYAGDGSCDCLGVYAWDSLDCSTCLDCAAQTSCTAGCTPNSGPDCTAANPSNLDQNGVCNCAGAYSWDDADCADCVSNDPDCPVVDSCPNGCQTAIQSPPACCADANDVCGLGNDGSCDCDGAWADGWDYVDCSTCSCN